MIHNKNELKFLRKELRKNLTQTEKKLWLHLKGKQLAGTKFRRQHSFGSYIIDFYCPAHKLAVEIDGPVHNGSEQSRYDSRRDQFMKSLGVKVLRFSNEDVCYDIEKVLEQIRKNIK